MINTSEIKKIILESPHYFPHEWIRQASELLALSEITQLEREAKDGYIQAIKESIIICDELIKENSNNDDVSEWAEGRKKAKEFIKALCR